MQRTLNSTALLAAMTGIIVATACSGDRSPVSPQVRSSVNAGRTDTSSNSPGSSPTPAGPVASVQVLPQQATITVGGYFTFSARPLDAKGALVANTVATWTSSNSAIVIPSDTGLVYGKALGTAKVYAAIDGRIDSATVTVVAAPTPPPPPPPAVSSFDLQVMVGGRVPGADTSHVAPIAGAVVKVTRTGGMTGDTLTTSVDAGSATTDATGAVIFKGLTGGSYSVDVTPPAGSSYAAARLGFAPPRTTTLAIDVALQPRS